MSGIFGGDHFDDAMWDQIFGETSFGDVERGPRSYAPRRSQAPVHVNCDYCGRPAKLVGGDEIYQHRKDLWDKKFWECIPCEAWVGCHPNSARPLGRLANAVLRNAKSAAHREFDKLWRNGGMSRSRAYAWLAERMEIPASQCHIGMFDEYQCAEVIVHCAQGVSKHAR